GANRSVCNAYELREVWQVYYHTLARANAQGEQAGRYGIGARVQVTVAPPCATAHNGQLIRCTGGAPAEHLTDRLTSPVAGAPVTFANLRRPLWPGGIIVRASPAPTLSSPSGSDACYRVTVGVRLTVRAGAGLVGHVGDVRARIDDDSVREGTGR